MRGGWGEEEEGKFPRTRGSTGGVAGRGLTRSAEAAAVAVVATELAERAKTEGTKYGDGDVDGGNRHVINEQSEKRAAIRGKIVAFVCDTAPTTRVRPRPRPGC